MTSIRSAMVAGFALAAASLGGGAVGDAAAQATQFRGNACIITATAACSAAGWNVGSCGTARFSPPNWNGNPNRTGFSVFWGYFYANNISYNGSLVGTVMRPVYGGGVGNSHYDYSNLVTARIGGQVPATLAPGTAVLSHTVFINRFDDVAGCNVSIRFQGQRHPLP